MGIEPKVALAVASIGLIILSFGTNSRSFSWTLRVMGALFGAILATQLDTSSLEFYMQR